jgi:hypothetical protein
VVHPFVRRSLVLWLPIAAISTVFAGVVYGAVQRSLRGSANDPQLQMAEDAAARMSAGATPTAVATGSMVDISRSLAPFTIILDASGHVLASTGQLMGETPVPPQGVLDAARASGFDSISWQPQDGVRAAIVVVPYSDGVVRGTVLVGRSLRAVEQREAKTLLIAGFAWIAALVGGAFAAGIAAFVWGLGDIPTRA